MADFLSAYSIQRWLESCPQGYLEDTEYGHEPGATESELVMENPVFHEDAIRTTVQLVLGERCALAASSGLINAAPDEASKHFLATQTLDEARHVEIFTQRLFDLGIKKDKLEDTLTQLGNPHLVEFAGVLLEKVDKKDFVAGVVGQNLILEGMAFTVFELLQASSEALNPKFAQVLSGTIADERRHVGFGENRIGSLIRQHPEKKAEVEQLQKDMTFHMLATFADSFSRAQNVLNEAQKVRKEAPADEQGAPAVWHGADLSTSTATEMEALLGSTVLHEFKTRLGRVGIEYQSPASN
jgi:1,2-phenylacetyl-CoA epoxidase catalytic subunit